MNLHQKNHQYCIEQPTWVGRSDCRSCNNLTQVLFSDLSGEELDDIVRGIHEPIDHFNYNTGSILYQEGHGDNAIYTIRSGLVKLVRYLPDGRERIIRLIKSNDSIGLERLLDKSYGHTAIALQPVTACRIPINVLQQLDMEKPRFYRQLMERWATALFQADDYIMMLLSGTVKERVVHLIQWLAEYTEDKEGMIRVTLLHGSDMSAMLDVTPESVSRVLAVLKRLNILQHVKGELYQYFENELLAYGSQASKYES